MDKHQQLIKNAKNAINELFSDKSVSPQSTLEDFHELREEIDIKIEGLQNDINHNKNMECNDDD